MKILKGTKYPQFAFEPPDRRELRSSEWRSGGSKADCSGGSRGQQPPRNVRGVWGAERPPEKVRPFRPLRPMTVLFVHFSFPVWWFFPANPVSNMVRFRSKLNRKWECEINQMIRDQKGFSIESRHALRTGFTEKTWRLSGHSDL